MIEKYALTEVSQRPADETCSALLVRSYVGSTRPHCGLADTLIWLMLRTRTDERTIRPTERVTWPKSLKRQLMRRQNNVCAYCGKRRTAPSFDIDHMTPVVRGGSNEASNLQVICRPCNQRKGDQTDAEFRARYSRLVPQRQLTPPRRPIEQRDFREETQLTTAMDSVRQFRRTRFISKRSKVTSGCAILGVAIAVVILFSLASVDAEGFLLLLPSLFFGGSAGSEFGSELTPQEQ